MEVKVIAPWREWDLLSRTKLIEYAEANGIPVPAVRVGCGEGWGHCVLTWLMG